MTRTILRPNNHLFLANRFFRKSSTAPRAPLRFAWQNTVCMKDTLTEISRFCPSTSPNTRVFRALSKLISPRTDCRTVRARTVNRTHIRRRLVLVMRLKSSFSTSNGSGGPNQLQRSWRGIRQRGAESRSRTRSRFRMTWTLHHIWCQVVTYVDPSQHHCEHF